jgi:putative Mg2+ transporter-C (MgtC) family protein
MGHPFPAQSPGETVGWSVRQSGSVGSMNRYGVPIDVVVRLVAAVALGALVGVEREVHEQAAGLRTHVAVCLGAALYGVISTTGFDEYQGVRASTNVQVDVTRVASNVAVGVGFLGAGLIYRERLTVHNLTTAASVWAVAAIGLTAGVGDVGVAALATGLALAYLVLLTPVRQAIRRHARAGGEGLSVTFTADVGLDDLQAILAGAPGLDADRLVMEKRNGLLVADLDFREGPNIGKDDIERFLTELAGRSDVATLERH